MPKGLAASITNFMGKPSSLIVGIAAAYVDNNTMVVNIRGTNITVSKLSSYSPSVGESVLIAQYGSTNIALGATGAPQPGHIIQRNREFISFTTQTSFVQNFTYPFPFNATPSVCANITSGSGSTAQWEVRAINTGPTSGQLFFFNPSGASSTWASVPVDWIAVGE
jgi:hypothetical protein